MESKTRKALTRRDALKTLAAVTGAVALASAPGRWETPVIEVGALPAHAQASAGVSWPDVQVERGTGVTSMYGMSITFNGEDVVGQNDDLLFSDLRSGGTGDIVLVTVSEEYGDEGVCAPYFVGPLTLMTGVTFENGKKHEYVLSCDGNSYKLTDK